MKLIADWLDVTLIDLWSKNLDGWPPRKIVQVKNFIEWPTGLGNYMVISNFNKGLLPPPRSASRVGGSPKYPFFNWELPDIHRCHYSCSTTQPMHLKAGASEHQYSSFSLHHYTKLSLTMCYADFHWLDIHMNKKFIENIDAKFHL